MEPRGPAAYYREFAPSEALREHVRAFFSCTASADCNPAGRYIVRRDPVHAFCPTVFADGHVSIVFAVGREHGEAIGPMTAARDASPGPGDETVGVYFRGAQAQRFTGVPISELADRVVLLEDLWGAAGFQLEGRIAEAQDEAARIGMMESALLKMLANVRRPNTSLDVTGLAASVLRRRGRLSVECLADAAGVSRQRLTRVFRENVGVSPKLFCRLARFRAALACACAGTSVDWAQVALEMGYSDQSHMIAEFREFSKGTPGSLATGRFFHPFLGRAWPRPTRIS
jgi:AraC-like DNA-binding protein